MITQPLFFFITPILPKVAYEILKSIDSFYYESVEGSLIHGSTSSPRTKFFGIFPRSQCPHWECRQYGKV